MLLRQLNAYNHGGAIVNVPKAQGQQYTSHMTLPKQTAHNMILPSS